MIVFFWLLLGLSAFGMVVMFEAGLRARAGHAIEIKGLPPEEVEAIGWWQPDFLWFGKAWWIEIETDRPVQLILDDWTGEIPPGVHKIFSNHDATNTGDFGDREFWGFPESVEIRVVTADR